MKKRICELIQSPIDMLPIKTIYDFSWCPYPIIAEYVIILLALFVFFLLFLVPYIFEDYEAFVIGIPDWSSANIFNVKYLRCLSLHTRKRMALNP